MMANGDPKTFWGWVASVSAAAVGSPVALPAAAVSGAVSVAKGGTFEEGASKVGDAYGKFVENAGEIGDEHSKDLTGAMLKGAAYTLGGIVTGNVFHHHHSSGS
jgi:hypothetical protein